MGVRGPIGCARLMGFARVLDLPPAFGLPLFIYGQEDEPSEHRCLMVQQIDEQDHIRAFVPFDPEDLEIIQIRTNLEKAPGDRCVLVYDIAQGEVLFGDHMQLRDRLLPHLNDKIFLQNPFSRHQAARFCRSRQAIVNGPGR